MNRKAICGAENRMNGEAVNGAENIMNGEAVNGAENRMNGEVDSTAEIIMNGEVDNTAENMADTETDNGKKTEGQIMSEKLMFKLKNCWDAADEDQQEKVFEFADGYKAFLDNAKTEREFTAECSKLLNKNGYIDLNVLLANNGKLTPGMKVYQTIRNKSLFFAVIGKKPMIEGVNLVGAHVDSPRVDLKANPLYEDTEMAMLDTQYYGGIKKYQWVTIPLAIHGVIIKADGEKVEVKIGEDDNDPGFTITDLLPHLAKDQMVKKASEVITGEGLNVLTGSIPFKDEKAKEKVKLNILKILNDKYGVVEQDFSSAELEIVPANKARDVGLDRSMIGAYGHDDRCCAFAAISAVMAIGEGAVCDNLVAAGEDAVCDNAAASEGNTCKDAASDNAAASEDKTCKDAASDNAAMTSAPATPEMTCICVLTDKEEVGSAGNTGAESKILENFIAYLCYLDDPVAYSDITLRRCLTNSAMLSADVNPAWDPNYDGVQDKKTASYLGKGIVLTKYTGSRGKSGASDANAEFCSTVRTIMNNNKVQWQFGDLGKVDQGGGGTIAQYIANLGVEVLDCGIPVLSMHAPFEIISKIDLYMTYRGYMAFLRDRQG